MSHRRLFPFLVLPLFAAAPAPSLPPSGPADIRAILQNYYAHPWRSPWSDRITALKSTDPHTRAQSVQLLLALVNHTYDPPPPETPMPDGRTSPDRARYDDLPYIVVREVVEGLDSFHPPAEALPLLAWAIDHDQSSVSAAFELAHNPGPDADALLQRLAEQPSPNRTILVTALQQVAARRLPMNHEKLLTLCHDYRPSIRNAARAAAPVVGLQNVPLFDEAHAFDDPRLKDFMAALKPLLPGIPPANAPFMIVTEPPRQFVSPDPTEIRGWVIASSATQITLLTPFQNTLVFTGHAQADSPRSQIPSSSITWRPLPLQEEISRINAIRASDKLSGSPDPFSDDSQFTSLTTDGLYEATIANWLYINGQPALAAHALLPTFDYFDTDADLLYSIAQDSSRIYAQHMLATFAMKRDYPATLALAAIVAKFPPDTVYQPLAQALLRELPLRTADFKTFTLPTPALWTNFQTTHSREEQISFLCEHLRLLTVLDNTATENHLSDKQYSKPFAMDEQWNIYPNAPTTELINPWNELGNMKLTLADIPAITPFLRENWHMLVLGTDRMNHPSGLDRTRYELAQTINWIAHANLCDLAAFDQMSPQALTAAIDTINHNARQSPGTTSPTPPTP